jgi:8-oxo-dGTP pyrophosphatase MutT (NUDIX family)
MPDKHLNPPAALPAATVILVRQDQAELQVYLLKRHAKSGFMAGNYVFAGGTLDPEDREFTVWKDHVDLDPVDLTSRLGGGLSAEEILAYAVAAIRETLEEAGVFLAREANRRASDLKRIDHLRIAGDLPKNWFLNLVVSGGWTLALSALSRWSHWITPVLMKRRFDTRFFLACMPTGQRCSPDGREITDGLWVSPKNGLRGNISGEIPLSPPTMVMLQELLKYPTLEDLQQAALTRLWGSPNSPRLIALDKGAVLVQPWDAEYGQADIQIDTRKLEKALLPAGEPFSRIWYREGLWRPVAA